MSGVEVIDIEKLQQDNANLQKELENIKQRKREKAKRRLVAEARLAEVHEQIAIVNDLNTAKETRAGKYILHCVPSYFLDRIRIKPPGNNRTEPDVFMIEEEKDVQSQRLDSSN